MSLKAHVISKIFSAVSDYLTVKHQQNEFGIKSLAIDSPCSAGDNFLSEIYSVSFEARINASKNSSEVCNLILKSQIFDPENPQDVRRYVDHFIFTKEMLMYTTVLGKLGNILREAGVPEEYAHLSPKLHHFFSEGESYSSLLMDNLVSLGYYSPETHGAGISLEECNSVMKALAKFHAASLVLEGQDAVPLSQTHEVCAAEFFLSEATSESMMPIVKGSYEGITQLAEKFRPDLVPLLNDLNEKESIWSRLCALVKPGVTSFSCLCHGDARLNNLFISKADINNVRFIDFQLTRYSSPVTDLQYVLFMGATKSFREQYTEKVLLTYFTKFVSILKKTPSVKLIQCQETAVRGWTMEKLQEEYEAMTMYGFLIAMTLLPIIMIQSGDIDKSVGQMGKEDRERFWTAGRKEMVFELGCKHEHVRQRLFDVCDEAFALFKKNPKMV